MALYKHNPNPNAFIRAARHVYNPIGFKKGYNFILFFIYAGAMLGFILPAHNTCLSMESSKRTPLPGSGSTTAERSTKSASHCDCAKSPMNASSSVVSHILVALESLSIG